MNLLTPLALLGLLTLPIILILHLLRNRREQRPISSLRLWRGLQQSKHGALPRQIPLSFLLLLQLLIALALTLGLARPAFSFLLDQPQQTIFILDTTTSMAAEDAGSGQAGERRFDVARQMIQTDLQTMGSQDTFALIRLDPQPDLLLAGDAELTDQALSLLDNLSPGATGVDLPAALTLANGLINLQQPSQITVLTDGTYPLEDETLPVMFAPVNWQIIAPAAPRPEGNQALLNVSAQAWPDGRHRLFVRVINYGQVPVGRTLRVSTAERVFAEVPLQLEPQAETARVWTLPEPVETATVEIVEPDSLPLDNRAEVWLARTTHLRVLLISETPETLGRALAAQPEVDLTVNAPGALVENLTDFDLVVFEGLGLPIELTAWPRGNLLVINPPLGHPLLPAQNFTHSLLRPDPATASALLTGVDLSGVYFNRVTNLSSLPDWAEVDLGATTPEAGLAETSLHNRRPAGQPLIFHGHVANSRLVVWAFDLAASNLPARLALPLLMANTLSLLLTPAPPPVVPVGEPLFINGNFSIEVPEGRRLFPPQQNEGWAGNVFVRTQQPGLYQIYNERDTPVAGFAVHAGSALESNLTPQLQVDQLNVERLTLNLPPPPIDYHEIWPWLAGLALGVVIVEGWLAWRK